MKYLILIVMACVIPSIMVAQKKEKKLLDQYSEAMSEENYSKALKTLEEFTMRFPKSEKITEVYFNKGILNSTLNNDSVALSDFTEACRRDTTFADAYRLKGNLYCKMKDTVKAMKEYDHALQIRPSYSEVYAAKGIILKKQNRMSEACKNFELALKFGYTESRASLRNCDSNSIVLQRFNLKAPFEKSEDPEYGYKDSKPILIGSPVRREKLFLSLLKGENGEPIKFKRTGSCCNYPSKNGFLGMALIDTYEIEVNGNKRVLYISFYDYEEPRIPVGLTQ